MHLVPGCPAHLVLLFVLFYNMLYGQINDVDDVDVKIEGRIETIFYICYHHAPTVPIASILAEQTNVVRQ